MGGAASPEELDMMLEDACVLRDPRALSGLFAAHAVLTTIGSAHEVTGRRAITQVVSEVWGSGGSYLAVPPQVLQSERTALVIAGPTVHVVRRGPHGWRYLISSLQISTPQAK
jgi:hypothetical protein